LVPVLVPLVPGVIVIAQLDGPPEPEQSRLFFAEQGVHGANPLGGVAIDNFLRFKVEYLGIDFVAPPLSCVNEACHQHWFVFSLWPAKLHSAIYDPLRLFGLTLV